MKALTGNRLTDGEAVWFSIASAWSETIADARLADDSAAEDELEAIGKAASRNNVVVDVDMIDVSIVDGAIRPLRLREQIRAAGPTNHRDHGKQARPDFRTA